MQRGCKRFAGCGGFLLPALFAIALYGCQNPGVRVPSAASFAQSGERDAEFELASRLIVGRGLPADLAAGEALFEQIAQRGNPLAMTIVGRFYLNGIGVTRDPTKAAEWFEKAAVLNEPGGTADLAVLYMRGIGVKQDYARAFTLTQPLAEHDVPAGQEILGVLYLNGWGVEKDEPRGLDLLVKAANKKLPAAMSQLSECYSDGKGVKPDKVIAYAWVDLAALNAAVPIERAAYIKARDALGLVLLPAEVNLAREIAKEWSPGKDIVALRTTASVNTSGSSDVVDQGPANSAPISVPSSVASAQAYPARVKLMTYDYQVKPDGSSTWVLHMELQAKNDAAIKDIAQVPLYFREGRDHVELTEAFTLKGDGRKMPVSQTAVYDQLVPGSPNVPMFDDQRQKVVVFPDVEVGDTVVISARYSTVPLLPGQFTLQFAFPRQVPRDDVRVTVAMPNGMNLNVETHEMNFAKHATESGTTYEWRYSDPNPPVGLELALDPKDRSPRLFASSFKSYDAFAEAYNKLSDAKSAVTPDIQKLADSVTAGITDRRDQAKAIYEWVSHHIRYVAVEIQDSAFIAHEASMVLANGYGDCKDHSILFQALLKAKGIAGNTVLINYGNAYSVPGPPSFGPFNHAITYLPEFDLFADTTAEVAPFGTLPFEQYGKPVVIVGVKSPVLRRIPLVPGGQASLAMSTVAKLSPDGKIEGDSETVSTGPFGIFERLTARQIDGMGNGEAAKQVLRSWGLEGIGSFQFSDPLSDQQSYRVTGHFETNTHPELISGNSFALPRGLELGARPGDVLLGPIEFRDLVGREPTPCYSGREVEDLSLQIPSDKTVRALPQPTDIKTDIASYSAKWSLNGNVVTLHREFTTSVNDAVCVGDVRMLAAKTLNQVRAAINTEVISLVSKQ